MTTMATDSYFEAMRLGYLYKLEEKLAQIESAVVGAATEMEDNVENLTVLYGALHKLIGSSGIYRLNKISYAATTFLDWVKPIKEQPRVLSPEELFQLDLLLDNLKEKVAFTLEEEIQKHEDGEILSEQVDHAPPALPESTAPVAKGFVYIVDDDKDQTMALEFYLVQAGFEVITFESLTDANEAIAQNKPAAVIMDMAFPEGELAGAEAIKSLQDSMDEELPVFFLSARRDIQARLAATRAGAMQYFTKPVDISRMIGELNKITRESAEVGGRVLLVDDDDDVTGLMGLQFEQEGFDVEILNNPFQILATIEKFDPDLVLIDIQMPGCSGLELASVIRQHEVYNDLPIMFLTSETDPKAKIVAMSLGSDDFFSKKLEPHLLIKAVKARMKRIREFAQVKKASIWSPN